MKTVNDGGKKMKKYTLANHVSIPSIGFGTWKSPNGEIAKTAVIEAIKCGYTHIDTAAIYGNEESVGQAIKEAGVPREKLFITSKVWNDDRGYEKTMKAFEESMRKLDCDYLDLYLIHWPNPVAFREQMVEMNNETWRAMEDLYKTGKVKAIGVSNFKRHHLEKLSYTIKPMVNQIEYHIGCLQEETVRYCQSNNILIEAWSPLGNGKIFACEKMKQFADKYNKSIAQIAIRYILQKGVLPLPKSITKNRIIENLNVDDFEISNEDMKALDHLDIDINSNTDPDTANF